MPHSAAGLHSHHTCSSSKRWSLGTPVCGADCITWRGVEEQSFGKGMLFPVGFSCMLNNPHVSTSSRAKAGWFGRMDALLAASALPIPLHESQLFPPCPWWLDKRQHLLPICSGTRTVWLTVSWYLDIWLLPNNNRWVLPNFSHGQFVEVVGTCSEPSASISDPLTGSKALTGGLAARRVERRAVQQFSWLWKTRPRGRAWDWGLCSWCTRASYALSFPPWPLWWRGVSRASSKESVCDSWLPVPVSSLLGALLGASGACAAHRGAWERALCPSRLPAGSCFPGRARVQSTWGLLTTRGARGTGLSF